MGNDSGSVGVIFMFLFFFGFIVSQNVLIAIITEGFEKAKINSPRRLHHFTTSVVQYLGFTYLRIRSAMICNATHCDWHRVLDRIQYDAYRYGTLPLRPPSSSLLPCRCTHSLSQVRHAVPPFVRDE